jgi:hypothetical protein
MRYFVVPSTGAGLWPATIGRDANLTPRPAQRSDRGPAERPSYRCAPPPPGVAFVTLRRIGRYRWIEANEAPTRECGLRRDLRSQTGAARRVFHGRRGAAPSPEKSVVMGALSPWRTPSRGAGACGIPGRTSTGAGVLACRRSWGAPQAVMARITVDVRACRFGRACRVGAKR